jgi:cytochrome c oxidase subunit 2
MMITIFRLFNVWLLAFIYILIYMVCIHRSACSSYSSAHGAEVDNLMNITWILIFIVQAITQVYYIILLLSTEGKDRKALYFADNNKLEALWSVIPIY